MIHSCPRPGTERHERPNHFRVVARPGCLGPRHTDESSAINDGRVPLGRLSTDDTNDSADEFWAVLEAETGYSSYVDYLKAYKAKHPQPYLKKLVQGLIAACNDASGYQRHRFTILDLSIDESSQPREVPRCDNDTAINTVVTLRQPPANVAVQIVLWNSDDYLNQSVVNALGLGLRIDLRFFGALSGGNRRHLDFRHVRFGGVVATVVRHYDPDKLDAVPIVLIARMEWEPMLADAVEKKIADIFPFRSPADESYQFYTPLYNPDPCGLGRYETGRSEHLNYTRLLSWYLENENELALDVTDGFETADCLVLSQHTPNP